MIEDYARGVPDPRLSAHVAAYSGYRSVGVAPAVHRGLPSPWVTVILTLDDPLVMLSHPDQYQPGGSYDALVGGLHTRPALITHDGDQSGIQLSLKPLGMRALTGVPAGELASVDVHAEDLLGPRVHLLRQRLLHCGSWDQRFAVLDEVLLSWVTDVPAPQAELVRAWQVLGRSGGAARVDDVAREVGWSARHLGQRFRTEVGLSPKALGRVIRFDRARTRLQADPCAVLADLAVDLGYYDQAHLAREFRSLAGLSPSAWVRAEVRSVQAPVDLVAAG